MCISTFAVSPLLIVSLIAVRFFIIRRFNELRKLIPDVTQRMLTKQLRELEADKIIKRKIYPEIPPKVEYLMTDLGLTLQPVIKSLQEWGRKYIEELENIRGHIKA